MMLVCFMSVYLHIIVGVCFAPNEIIPDIIISRQFLRVRPISQEKKTKIKPLWEAFPKLGQFTVTLIELHPLCAI